MKLSKLVAEKFNQHKPYYISSYALRDENGFVRYHISDVCFARAVRSDGYGPLKGDIVEVAMSLNNAKTTLNGMAVPNIYQYSDFILNRSIFKDAFLTKNLRYAWRYGVDLDVDQSHSYCVAAMIAMREGWEFPDFLSNWKLLVHSGFDENFSYIVARMFSVREGKVHRTGWGGHQTLGYNLEKGLVKKLLKEGCYMVEPSFRKTMNRYEIFRTTRSNGGGDFNIFLGLNAEEVKGKFSAADAFSLDAFLSNLKNIEKEMLQ